MNAEAKTVLMVNGKVIDEEWAVAKCAYYGVPDYMASGLFLYLVHHISPGGFLQAVLSNDFMGAVMQADVTNAACLEQWAQLLHWELPRDSFGSQENVRAWLRKGEG